MSFHTSTHDYPRGIPFICHPSCEKTMDIQGLDVQPATDPRNRDVVLHPFTFDTADVPTGVTSVTRARKLRIDAIVYQCQRLELVAWEKGRASKQLWMTGWWFGTFFIFPYIENNHPN